MSAADHAFIDAMATTTSIAAAVALAGALVALAFLPARERRSHVHTDRAMTGHTAAAEA